MHGNLWEYAVDNPNSLFLDLETNRQVVQVRGGSWSDNLVHLRSANRHTVPIDVPWALAGIRLVLDERSPATEISE